MGDHIEVLPSGLRGRIRGLQTHRKAIDRAVPGSRTAVNIAGIQAERLSRGQVLSRPGCYDATLRVDARLRLLADVSRPLVHNSEVKAFLGTAESLATLRLLDKVELAAGEEGWIQLELRDPLVCVRGDAFILRRPSPAETVGGGTIVDPKPPRRHKRFDETLLASLDALGAGNPADVLLEAARALRAAPLREIVHRSHLARNPAESGLEALLLEGKLIALEPGDATVDGDILAMSAPDWEALESQSVRTVSGYHARFPLRPGIPREELKSQLEVGPRLFSAAVSRLVSQGTLRESRLTLSSSAHRIRFDERQQASVDRLMAQFMRSPFSPPGLKDCQAAAGEEIVAALIAMGDLIAVSNEIVFAKNDYDAMVAQVRGSLEKRGQITLAEVRDEFRTSRKYAQALLEHLDATGMTKRLGDARVLAGRATPGQPGGA
jgi:selenocysteine-specific elongation factor